MAITFPRELHSYDDLEALTFNVVNGDALNRTDNGRAVSSVDHHNPYIVAEFELGPLYPESRRGWSSWKNSLRGAMKSFLAYDLSRQYPLAYPNGIPSVIAATWSGQGTTIALSARETTIDGVPVGYVATAGDALGFVQDDHYSWHEITEGGTANASEELVVAFDPYVPLQMFSIGATAVLWRPKARFVLDVGSWRERGDESRSPISFTGLQVF